MNATVLRRRLAELMQARNLSMRELSLAAGLSETAVKAIMKGRSRNPRISSVQAIAEVLGTTPSSLLDIPPKPAQTHRLLMLRLQAAADEARASSAQMAELAGVAEEDWLSWIQGRSCPSCSALAKLCDAIPWLKLDWLYRGDPEPMPVNRYLRLRVRVEAALDAGASQEPALEEGGYSPHEEPEGAEKL